VVMKCSKCGCEGGRGIWKFIGNLNVTGTLAYRQCPECGHLEVCDEFFSNEEYRGPQSWGTGKFRGKVFKGKKKKPDRELSQDTNII